MRVDIIQWKRPKRCRAQELCESRDGRPGLLSLIRLRFLWTESNTSTSILGQSSGAVRKSRWPSWAPVPNKLRFMWTESNTSTTIKEVAVNCKTGSDTWLCLVQSIQIFVTTRESRFLHSKEEKRKGDRRRDKWRSEPAINELSTTAGFVFCLCSAMLTDVHLRDTEVLFKGTIYSLLYPSKLSNCVKKEVGLGSHSSHVLDEPYGLCGRKVKHRERKKAQQCWLTCTSTPSFY